MRQIVSLNVGAVGKCLATPIDLATIRLLSGVSAKMARQGALFREATLTPSRRANERPVARVLLDVSLQREPSREHLRAARERAGEVARASRLGVSFITAAVRSLRSLARQLAHSVLGAA